jgi:hypothetical protein
MPLPYPTLSKMANCPLKIHAASSDKAAKSDKLKRQIATNSLPLFVAICRSVLSRDFSYRSR